jgi:hypothetical protein
MMLKEGIASNVVTKEGGRHMEHTKKCHLHQRGNEQRRHQPDGTKRAKPTARILNRDHGRHRTSATESPRLHH